MHPVDPGDTFAPSPGPNQVSQRRQLPQSHPSCSEPNPSALIGWRSPLSSSCRTPPAPAPLQQPSPFWWRTGWNLQRRLEEWSLASENVEKEVNEVGAEGEEEDEKEEEEGKAKEEDEQDESENNGDG